MNPVSLGYEDVPLGGVFAASPHVLEKNAGRVLRRHRPCGADVPDIPSALEAHARECARRTRKEAQREEARRRRENAARLRLIGRLRREAQTA